MDYLIRIIHARLWLISWTIKEHKKKFKDLKISWIGDGNNVCNSLIFGCSKTQTDIVIATPKGFEPNPEVVKKASENTTIDLTTDPESAVKDADIVMTDTFYINSYI